MKRVFLYGDPQKRINYIQALEANGMEAVVSEEMQAALSCDGLLLPGGGDMDPALFHEENHGSQGIDRELDEIELSLLKSFGRQNKAVLGICRGMQVLAVGFGGSLIQDLPTAAAHRWNEKDMRHRIFADKGGFLNAIYGEEFFVNSAHHQGVGKIPQGFQIAARAEDGVIEALACPERNMYGVQWHPERMTAAHARTDTVDGQGVFRFFNQILESV